MLGLIVLRKIAVVLVCQFNFQQYYRLTQFYNMFVSVTESGKPKVAGQCKQERIESIHHSQSHKSTCSQI